MRRHSTSRLGARNDDWAISLQARCEGKPPREAILPKSIFLMLERSARALLICALR